MTLKITAIAASLLLAAQGEVRVTATTKSGKTLKGALSVASIRLKAAFGEVSVEAGQLVSIQFGTTDVVTTKEKTTLKGRILLEEFRLKTESGEVTLRRADLSSLTVDGAGGGPLARGAIEDGTASNGVTYHVRLPQSYDPKKGKPAILILHGSNMNTKAYVHTIASAWPKLAEDYVLIGINGENRARNSSDENPAYNYTYVNFGGKSKYQGATRESPALIVEVLGEIKKRVAIGKIFVGGHSQGGYCTYVCYMNYPELFAGAFPVSGGLIIQAEPGAYENAEVRAQQRKGAMAIVHGENDGVVEFSMGKNAYESFLEEGFPALRLFAHKTAAHMFAVLPVEEAVRWLEAMASDDPAALLDFAQKRLAAREYRDALAAAERARSLDAPKRHAAKVKAIHQAVDREAGPKAKALEKALAGAKNDSWVADFVAFRTQFEHAEAAKGVMEIYGKLRAQHEKPAEELFWSARRDFQTDNRDAAYKKYEEIVTKYYASSWYRYAKSGLARRK